MSGVCDVLVIEREECDGGVVMDVGGGFGVCVGEIVGEGGVVDGGERRRFGADGDGDGEMSV